MNNRIQPQRTPAKNRSKQHNPKRWRVIPLMFACSVMLVSGFLLAGRQHFSSMDFGMKNSRLRKQIDELEAEKRRLLLTREMSLSPAEIKKAAKKTGLTDTPPEGDVARITSATGKRAGPATAEVEKSMVIKTAAVSAARPEEFNTRPERIAKQIKKNHSTE